MAPMEASDTAFSDLGAAIRDFAADDGRDSMQLPRLTTGQRRRVRAALAEEHPGLRCENSGLGTERRLVLLKGGAAVAPATPDDLTPAGDDLEAAIATFLADAARASWELPALTAEQRREAKRLAEAHPELRCESFGLGAERRLHVFKRSDLALPLPPRGDKAERHSDTSTCASPSSAARMPLLQVRNTFLCTVDAEAGDTRAVQSMPGGLFGHLLLEELLQSKLSLPGGAFEEPAAPSGPFESGMEVEIHGLTMCPAFNGCRGSVQQLDEASGRYDVLLEGPGQRWAKIRAENLRLVSACPPPSFAPSMGGCGPVELPVAR